LPGTIHKTVEEIKEAGGQAVAIKCDVTNKGDVEAMVNRVLDEFGQIDVLVNNAGVGYYQTVRWTLVRHWDLIMKVNLRGPFLCIANVLPAMMKNRRGSIINISCAAAQEILSQIVRPDGTRRVTGCAFGASKAALERLTVGLAEEVREYNIAVNALKAARLTYSPGLIAWNPQVDESTFVSPHLFMTRAAIFLAAQDANGLTGGIFFDEELCRTHNLTQEV
jgi:citronellol/citronellal dehydrogenase